MVECRRYQPELRSCWDQFVRACRTPLFFFQRDFLEYHQHRFKDASLLFYIKNKLVALFPATEQDFCLISHAGLSYGGLLFDQRLRFDKVVEVMLSLADQANRDGNKKIIYKAIPYIFYQQGSQEDLYALVHYLDAKIVRRDLSSIIYLKQRMKLSKGRKWLIGRAKKQGLKVIKSTNWAAFHSLLSTVLARHKANPVHSSAELEYLATRFPQQIELKVIEQEKKLVAAVLLFKFNTTVHSQYLASSDEGKKIGALDFLIEECIEEASREHYLYFSFGISTEEQGLVLNKGLISQKESFGARGLVLDFYEINLSST